MLGYVYFITDGINIKIGFTSKSIKKRLKQLQTGNDKPLYILGYISGTKETESNLHKLFHQERIRYNGEWFAPSEFILDYINRYNEKPNTIIDYVDGKLMSLLSLKQS